MNHYRVIENGIEIGQRRTPRQYSHAVVATFNINGERRLVVGFSRTEALAHKAAATARGKHWYSDVVVLPVEAREIVRRGRVRCTGLNLVESKSAQVIDGAEWRYPRLVRCLRDAVEGDRCKAHVGVDLNMLREQAIAGQHAYNVALRRDWDRRHAAQYTVETCPTEAAFAKYHGGARCPIHTEGVR